MCGEHPINAPTSTARAGSSPHVRGARAVRKSQSATIGIIPACAGSTSPFRRMRCLRRDHPRMCGEHHRNQSSPPSWAGSSPHVRGAPSLHHRRMRSHGIIPACAGSTASTSHTCVSAGDHPRMCGEHIASPLQVACFSESSPHVRGAPCGSTASTTNTGIIPACAGSTFPARRCLACRWDHPRMCGEHPNAPHSPPMLLGSSPHVRGAQTHLRRVRLRLGIIPACAGSTSFSFGGLVFPWDHPRMCGEHDLLSFLTATFSGSSPHVRGAHHARNATVNQPGIIPACAGSTMRYSACAPLVRDHPRMCGEHLSHESRADERLGSSPHVRGARLRGGGLSSISGIIPACAGSTHNRHSSSPPKRDHPRMCGEHEQSQLPPDGLKGSSPHVRGALEPY